MFICLSDHDLALVGPFKCIYFFFLHFCNRRVRLISNLLAAWNFFGEIR